MTRIPEAPHPGVFARFVYWMVKRQFGRVVFPLRIMAHLPKLLWGYGQMEMSIQKIHSMNETLKTLAGIKTAMLIGCPF